MRFDAKPFLRWAGGKWKSINLFSRYIPENFNTMLYVEPFVGSGAMLFHKQPDHAIISDLNTELVNAYLCIKDNLEEFMSNLRDVSSKDTEENYLSMRAAFNACKKKEPCCDGISSPIQAARFVYLIARCFNGLYRENEAGQFNVAYAKDLKGTKVIADEYRFLQIHRYLTEKDVDVYNMDYKDILEFTREKSQRLGMKCFYFLDPTYYPLHANGFTKYNKGGWTDNDFKELGEFVRKIDERGDKFMLCNHDVPRIRQIFKGFNMESHVVPRCISCDARHRTPVKEVVVMNYRNSSLMDYVTTKGSNADAIIER